MEENITSLSLLQGIREHDATQWDRFGRIYTPLVYSWCRKGGVLESDAPDVVQEVFQVVFKKIEDFRRDQPGDSFHGWLYGVTRHKVLDHFRRKADRPVAIGGSTAYAKWQEIAVALPEQLDEREIQQETLILYRQAYELLRSEFEDHTWKAFWRVAVDGVSAKFAAEEQGMTVGAVYNAKSKVLRRLREEFAGLV